MVILLNLKETAADLKQICVISTNLILTVGYCFICSSAIAHWEYKLFDGSKVLHLIIEAATIPTQFTVW